MLRGHTFAASPDVGTALEVVVVVIPAPTKFTRIVVWMLFKRSVVADSNSRVNKEGNVRVKSVKWNLPFKHCRNFI